MEIKTCFMETGMTKKLDLTKPLELLETTTGKIYEAVLLDKEYVSHSNPSMNRPLLVKVKGFGWQDTDTVYTFDEYGGGFKTQVLRNKVEKRVVEMHVGYNGHASAPSYHYPANVIFEYEGSKLVSVKLKE